MSPVLIRVCCFHDSSGSESTFCWRYWGSKLKMNRCNQRVAAWLPELCWTRSLSSALRIVCQTFGSWEADQIQTTFPPVWSCCVFTYATSIVENKTCKAEFCFHPKPGSWWGASQLIVILQKHLHRWVFTRFLLNIQHCVVLVLDNSNICCSSVEVQHLLMFTFFLHQ